MKVWIVFAGEYEQRGIVGVYEEREMAYAVAMPITLKWMRQWNPAGTLIKVTEEDCDVEEHNVIPHG